MFFGDLCFLFLKGVKEKVGLPLSWVFSSHYFIFVSKADVITIREKISTFDIANEIYLYNASQSPLMPEVNWGPECSTVCRNSSGSNCRNNGAPWIGRKKNPTKTKPHLKVAMILELSEEKYTLKQRTSYAKVGWSGWRSKGLT